MVSQEMPPAVQALTYKPCYMPPRGTPWFHKLQYRLPNALPYCYQVVAGKTTLVISFASKGFPDREQNEELFIVIVLFSVFQRVTASAFLSVSIS